MVETLQNFIPKCWALDCGLSLPILCYSKDKQFRLSMATWCVCVFVCMCVCVYVCVYTYKLRYLHVTLGQAVKCSVSYQHM